MKTVFTCDDVFEVLTREPFPSGGVDDEVVESHLAVCHPCRRLAEAFRPAVGLFHESLSADVDDELPMYRGRLQPIIDGLTPTEFASRNKSGRALTVLKMAIAAGLLLVGSVVVALVAARPSNEASMSVASTVLPLDARDYTLLAALEIPSSCRSLLEESDEGLLAEFVCCTKCHHATSQVTSTHLAISKTAASCAACHDRVLGEALSLVAPGSQACESLLAYAPIQNL